jgi:light-regulated signal transduction histidine kinase (bacteriophytochrome)
MFAIVKTKSNDYFHNSTTPSDIYDKTKTYKEKRTFFTYFITHYLKEPLKIVEFITNLIDKKSFEDDSFLSVIWAISLQLSNQNTELTQLSDLVKLINSKSLIQKSKLL